MKTFKITKLIVSVVVLLLIGFQLTGNKKSLELAHLFANDELNGKHINLPDKQKASRPEYMDYDLKPISDVYNPYWELGKLDPVRSRNWPKLAKDQLKLELVPIKPVYTDYISRGDYADQNAYGNYPLKKAADGSLMITKDWGPKTEFTVFIDFGVAFPGNVEFEANLPAGQEVEVYTGEAMEKVLLYGITGVGDGTRKKFKIDIERGGWAGMRFVWLRFKNLKEKFNIYDITGHYQIFPCNYIGNFECSDEMITRIWEMCAYTAHAIIAQPHGNDDYTKPQPTLMTLCMDRVDRFPWLGDSRVMQTAVGYVFGQYDILRKALHKSIAGNDRPMLNTGIPQYTLDWGFALIDYYDMSGDKQYFESRFKALVSIAEDHDELIDNNFPNHGTSQFWVDWDHRWRLHDSSPEMMVRKMSHYVGKYVQFCKTSAEYGRNIGRNKEALHLEQLAKKQTDAWLAKHPDWEKQIGIHSVTQLVLGGVITADQYQKAYDLVYSDRGQRMSGTPYFGIYVLHALDRIGHYNTAVQVLSDYWGSMIKAGATTTWEEWGPTRRIPMNHSPTQWGLPANWGGLSLIQAAGSGPAQWILKQIVGIKPYEPGFKITEIYPRPSYLKWAKGTVASPHGPISASWKKLNDKFQLNFNAPAGVQSVRVLMPAGKKYVLDGAAVKPNSIEGQNAVFNINKGSHEITTVF
jgi:hypothetical protein